MAATVSVSQVSLPAFNKQNTQDLANGSNGCVDDVHPTILKCGLSSKPTLPTLDKLGVKNLPADVDATEIASSWFEQFARYAQSLDVDGILSLFVKEDAFWRDLLALTWDFRTFESTPRIKQFLADRLAPSKLSSFQLSANSAQLERKYVDLAWIQAFFTFETEIGHASGIFRLVPVATSNGQLTWRAHAMFTNLEELKGFPEKIGSLREHRPNHGKWLDNRRREIEFAHEDPKVIIIGGGQSGLEVAARLKYLDVPSLIIEKQPRIGHNWRTRYEALCLHDPVWYDHMPYIPFPPSWPVYTPAMKLADWLESYAHTLELNVWTSSSVIKADQDEGTKKWSVTIKRGEDGAERTFHVNHLIFATGFGGGNPRMPTYPGMDEFEGEILHSTQHKSAKDHIGKKVVVIGACTSGHDICSDHVDHGVDVTLFQRGPTYVMSNKEGMPRLLGPLYWENALPIDTADRINASFPNPLAKLVNQRVVKDIADADKELLDGLAKRGFKLSMGEDGSGSLLLTWKRGGGYYLDVGASQLIIDGKIKLKSDSLIERFTKTGIKFEDGSELSCNTVIFATGFGDPRDSVIRVFGETIAGKLKPIWGLDDEGEIRGAWRDLGVPNLWCMMGNFALCRFYSKHLALQIKALEEGVWDATRYSGSYA